MHIGGSFFDSATTRWFRPMLLTLFVFATGIVLGSVYCACMPQTAQEALYGGFSGQSGLLTVKDSARVFRAAFIN